MKKTVKQQLLKIMEMHRGEILSGENIAKDLGVSRVAVSKAVAALKKDGYKIDSKTRIGYIFLDENDIYSLQSIEKHLNIDKKLKFDIREELDSTNTQLKAIAQSGQEEGYVLIANKQISGRGRRGRTFFSESSGLYMSILLKPTVEASQSLLITTAAAVAVSRAIEKISERKCKIKWVNDIYCDGKKVCGILTEASVNFESGTLEYAVLGIGINLSDPKGGFPEEISRIAGSIFGKEKYTHEQKSILTAEICNEFFKIYEELSEKAFMQEYRRRSFLIGKEVDVIVGENKTEEALVIDIDNDAHLIIRDQKGEIKPLFSGDVSVRMHK